MSGEADCTRACCVGRVWPLAGHQNSGRPDDMQTTHQSTDEGSVGLTCRTMEARVVPVTREPGGLCGARPEQGPVRPIRTATVVVITCTLRLLL